MKKREINRYMKEIAAYLYENECKEYVNEVEYPYIVSNDFKRQLEMVYFKEKKRKRRNMYKWSMAYICMLLTFGVVLWNVFSDSNIVIAAQIEYNLTKISELDLNTVLSSNPYAYKDSENYNNIIKIGPAAIEVLEQKYQNNELAGFDAYIAAAAIEDIANVTVMSVTGQDWESAEQFYPMWNELMSELPYIFKEITESKLNNEEKIEAIRQYGIFGDYYLQLISNSEDDKFIFMGCEIENTHFVSNGIEDGNSENDNSAIERYLENKLEIN